VPVASSPPGKSKIEIYQMENSSAAPEPRVSPWLDVEMAAEYLHVSQGTVRKILHEGKLKAARIGPHFRIEKSDLDAWLARQKKTIPPYRKGSRPWVAGRHARNRKRGAR